MTPILCQDIRRAPDWTDARDQVKLTYDWRFLRRRVLTTTGGLSFLVDLAQTASLDHGDAFVLSDGRVVEVVAADEDLLEVTGSDLPRIAWHIGNRHSPCQIEADRLVIQRDHVMVKMLAQIGAATREITGPFRPEGGAYGHGRTHGHDHSHAHHAPQDHDHTHA